MKRKEILPLAVLALIVGPATVTLLRKPKPEPAPEPVLLAAPQVVPRAATAPEWFAQVRPRCTPADVRLATDLNPPPSGAEGLGYKAACFGLARQIPSARSLLLSLPEAERVRGATVVYDVAQQLAAEGRHDVAGPLMELVLEFWPDHHLALYEAGNARYLSGDVLGAQDFLARFLTVYPTQDDLTANARRMMERMAER